eukprot:7391922-Prymnesium_polylepis.1
MPALGCEKKSFKGSSAARTVLHCRHVCHHVWRGGRHAQEERHVHVGLGQEALHLAPDPTHDRVLLVGRRCVVGIETSSAQVRLDELLL